MFAAFWGEQQAAVAIVASACIFLSALARHACLPLTPTAIAISMRCMGEVFLASTPDAKFRRPELISHRSVTSGCVRPVCDPRSRDH
jgi:hypothetical protein